MPVALGAKPVIPNGVPLNDPMMESVLARPVHVAVPADPAVRVLIVPESVRVPEQIVEVVPPEPQGEPVPLTTPVELVCKH